jgi:hypothetical protein
MYKIHSFEPGLWSLEGSIMRALRVLALLCCLAIIGRAQQNTQDRIEVGVNAAFNLNTHKSGVISSSSGVTCCGDFTEGVGRGFSAALLVSLPVLNDFRVEARLIISDGSVDFEEDVPFTSPDGLGDMISGLSRYHYKTDLIVAGFEVMMEYNPIAGLTIATGPGVYMLAKKKYNYSQYLLEPAGYEYIGGTRTDHLHDGSIENTVSPMLAAVVNAGYRIPLGAQEQYTIHPEMSYKHFFSNIVDGSDWTLNALGFGLSFRMSL